MQMIEIQEDYWKLMTHTASRSEDRVWRNWHTVDYTVCQRWPLSETGMRILNSPNIWGNPKKVKNSEDFQRTFDIQRCGEL